MQWTRDSRGQRRTSKGAGPRAAALWLAAWAIGCSGGDGGGADTDGAIAEDAGADAAAADANPMDANSSDGNLTDGGSRDSAAEEDGGTAPGRVVLFGDLHAHTYYSLDAFSKVLSEPTDQPRDPAEACAYARRCAGLDFYANTDHAESLTAELWRRTREQVSLCDAEARAVAEPFHAFVGFEWSESGRGSASLPVYGHKNVIFRDIGPADLPARAIGSFDSINATPGSGTGTLRFLYGALERGGIDRPPFDEYSRFFMQGLCNPGVPSPSLPVDCYEVAETPAVLFRKLHEWDLPAIVIPHGTAWTIAPADWRAQANPFDHDPDYQRLVEIYSQHGSSESLREYPSPWRFTNPTTDAACAPGRVCDSNAECGVGYRCVADRCETATCLMMCQSPPAGSDHLPCCWRALQLAESRPICVARPDGPLCAALKRSARRYGAIAAADGDDWLACDQCTDCFQPAANYQGHGAVQAALATTGFAGAGDTNFHFGFVGSTDGHRAFPGSVKEIKELAELFSSGLGASAERASTDFLYAGGLVAVQATAATREAIWRAMQERRVYATSGPRIVLAFDLMTGSAPRPMGSIATVSGPRTFRVEATGAFPQRPGCPEELRATMGDDFIENVCSGECHFPDTAARRLRITRIEVVRIQRQTAPDQPLGTLIEDDPPWRTLTCPGGLATCSVTFADDAPPDGETAYYVRAIQEPTPMVNGDPLRCIRDADGRCIASTPCDPDDDGDDCLGANEERAWSSPIYVTK